MNKPKNILIIEHEALTIDAIKKAFNDISNTNTSQKFNFTVLKTSAHFLECLKEYNSDTFFDIVILNINMPKPDYKKVSFTEDICLELRKLYHKVKVILLSSFLDNYRVHNTFKTLSPDSFLIKSDIDYQKLVIAISYVLDDTPYYSKQILNSIRNVYRSDLYIDKINTLILYYLSKGTRTKDLTKLVPLTIGGIEKRKRQLKELFNVTNSCDKDLLLRAREKGII